MTFDQHNRSTPTAAPVTRRSRFKERYLAEHGDGPETREVFRIFDAACARVQATCDIGPIEPKVKGAGSASYMAERMGLNDTP